MTNQFATNIRELGIRVQTFCRSTAEWAPSRVNPSHATEPSGLAISQKSQPLTDRAMFTPRDLVVAVSIGAGRERLRISRRCRRSVRDTVDEDGKLHVAALVAVPDPPSLLDLRRRVVRTMPKIDLPELVLDEVMSWHPGFVDAFTHVLDWSVRAIAPRRG